MQKDPLIRSVDAISVRLQMQRRGLHRVVDHPLWQEAGARLRERLDLIRCGQGPCMEHGLVHYGQPMNPQPQSLQRIESVGLLSVLSDLRSTLGFWAHALAPGGLVMFVTLGPDSFRGLALALGDLDQSCHVAGYPDMHDIGDALVALNMADPVMDAEWLTLTYSTPESALADLRSLGGNALLGRPKALRGRAWRARVLSALESLRANGVIALQVELVFGHAWAADPASRGQPKDPKGPQPITWQSRLPGNASGSI